MPVSPILLDMGLIQYSDKIDDYAKRDGVVDFDNLAVARRADELYKAAPDELAFIQAAYEFVRDKIPHSADINADALWCSASEVLEAGHGICFAKSHLLAALLRCKGVPAGFCYQKIILDDETAPILVYHGLNGVYVNGLGKWIRLDARGNKAGVDAQFSVDTERLAFAIRAEKGEEDGFMIYPDPDKKIVELLRSCKTRTELWNNLPTELNYTN